MDYTAYKEQIATMAVVPVDDPNYLIILPQMINYAELRIQRELDFLSTQVENTAYTLTANNNTLTIPTSSFVTLQTVQVVDGDDLRQPLTSVTKDFLQNMWGNVTGAGVPTFFAVFGGDAATAGNTSQNIIFGPWPDAAYPVVLTGTIRSAPLGDGTNGTQTSTFISTYLPDLMIMASMIYVSAYQRNFGRMNDDPQMAQSYESQYQALKAGAMVEESRKKFQAAAWSSMSPAPVASPTR
jgi:hypothetical protein